MSTAALQTTAGVITIGAGALFALAWLTSMVFGDPRIVEVELSRWLALAAHIFMLLGLVGIYLVQAEHAGAWGLAGFLLAFTGVAIFIGYVVGGWTTVIPEPQLGPIGGLIWLVGLLILAVVTWQSGVLARWAGIVWLVGAVVFATAVPSGPDDSPPCHRPRRSPADSSRVWVGRNKHALHRLGRVEKSGERSGNPSRPLAQKLGACEAS